MELTFGWLSRKWATEEFIRAVWSVAMDCEMCDDDYTVADHGDDDDGDADVPADSSVDHLENVRH